VRPLIEATTASGQSAKPVALPRVDGHGQWLGPATFLIFLALKLPAVAMRAVPEG
jgi:hypothetical protein